MFIQPLTNGNFALFQSNLHGKPTFIAECESYEAAMEMKEIMEER